MRLQKFMAQAGIASRRKCEELIKQGKVFVNGQRVDTFPVTVDPEKDEVTYKGNRYTLSNEYIYIMLNKPVGYVCTCHDEKGRNTVLDLIPHIKQRVYPVGRLDFTTEGLLLLTNDGELAQRLTHPRHEVTKRYLVIVDSLVTNEQAEKLENGIFIDGTKTAPAKIKILKAQKDRTELTIIIKEGKNRQVRRMFEAIEKNCVFLKRISVGDINLGDLKKGKHRELTPDEIKYLKSI